MTFSDLFKMSLDNLFRRKLRTVLTILGVLIGTASIVAMLSLGLELKRNSLRQTENQMKTIQMAVGGIGAVSFIVAASAPRDAVKSLDGASQ